MCSTPKDTESFSYKDAFSWVCSFDKYGWVFGLERVRLLLQQLGNPHETLAVIHVGGTNGKGSVCKFISSILLSAGYSVGVYLSPHLERFSERIVVNDQEISADELTMLVSQIKPFVEEMIQQDNTPTFFEIVTVLAFMHFQNQSVDYAIVEVGLGGRLDATNVVNPLLSVITNVSLEHTDILGKEITSIASEKAGIIKEHIPVVTAATHDALNIIKTRAAEKHASLVCIDQKMWSRVFFQGLIQGFIIHGSFKDYNVKTSLLGQHQGENIALAIAAVERLQMKGVFIADHDIVEGIAATSHPGRMELVSREPLILLDGAHNPGGMKMLAETIKQDFSSYRLILVLGMLKDKDIRTMIVTIAPLAKIVILTKSANPRAADPSVLKFIVETVVEKTTVFVEPLLQNALRQAKRVADPHDLICVSGSLFNVGEAPSINI
jgi:dihydrofolate synthase/folylpolyglutamate synthase